MTVSLEEVLAELSEDERREIEADAEKMHQEYLLQKNAGNDN